MASVRSIVPVSDSAQPPRDHYQHQQQQQQQQQHQQHHRLASGDTSFAAPGPGSPSSQDSPPADNKGMPPKQQKACVHCRKSKVKCVHDGGPPCRRCSDSKLECKFRVRADDENWRERTDETLNRLNKVVDALFHQQATSGPPPAPGPSIMMPVSHPPPAMHPYPPPVAQQPMAMPPPVMPSPGPHRHRHGSVSYRNQRAGGVPGPAGPSGMPYPAGLPPPPGNKTSPQGDHPPFLHKPSPHSDHGNLLDYPSPGGRLPLPLNNHGNNNAAGGGPESGSSDALSHHDHRRRSSSLRSVDAFGPHGFGVFATPHSPRNAGPYSTSLPTPGGIGSGSRYGHAVSPLPPPVPTNLPPPTMSSDQHQTAGAPSLQAVPYNSTPFYLTNPLPMRWTSGITAKESYGAPVAYIGTEDPRLTCISRNLIPLEKVRQLFIFFAERMQPHSFGFASFPPSEHMTPLIIAAIAMTAALHEPTSRTYHSVLKADVLKALPNHELDEDHPLDPEIGIGVEEITAACIASAWLGGEDAWRLARLARWWTLAYLRHYDIQTSSHAAGVGRTVTLGETLTILPPFRSIDLPVKLRIWLQSYIVDAQQSIMLDRAPMAASQPPSLFVDALRNVYGGAPASGAGGSPKMSQPDRQLVAHAALLDILLESQRMERSQASELAFNASGPAHEDSVRRRIGQILGDMEAIDLWRERGRSHEDLSAATPSTMDVTFVYFLARTFIGSQALPLPGVQPGTPSPSVDMDRLSSMASSQVSLVSWAKDAALSALELACEKKGRGFGDRIVAMPTWYHFMLSHVVGFLLQLIQRKHRFLLAREARVILLKVEAFVQLYVFEINSHAYQAPAPPGATGQANGYGYTSSSPSSSGHGPGCGGAGSASDMDAANGGNSLGNGNSHGHGNSSDGGGSAKSIGSADRHPATGMAEMMARSIAHVKAQSKG